MPTLGTLKSRIADDLARSDLTSQIASAISDAIAEHERERFWFNESRDKTFSTVDGQRIYTSSDASWIPDVIELDGLFVTVGGQVRELRKEDPAALELLSDSTTEGAPYCWAYLNSSIQLYPTPDQVYTVRAVAHVRLAALSGDSDSNAWTTEAEQLIRRTAKVLLSMDTTQDRELAVALDPLIQRNLEGLRAETSRRKTLGRIVPTRF